MYTSGAVEAMDLDDVKMGMGSEAGHSYVRLSTYER